MLNFSAKVKISKRKTTFFVHKYVVNSLIISQKCRLLGLPLTKRASEIWGFTKTSQSTARNRAEANKRPKPEKPQISEEHC